MKREIKFRALLKKSGEHPRWVYYTTNEIAYVDDGSWDAITVSASQYTGLKDKNGKEIYEGDIVKDYHGALHTVKIPLVYIFDAEYGGHFTGGEVIGNIYENPDLLNTKPTE